MRIAFRLIDSEQTELGVVSLHHYQAETGEAGYEVRIDDAFLMASHGAWGEVAMARLARMRLPAAASGLRVLVGGLGAGHTLRAALALPGVAAVDVVEISAKVVAWNRRYFAQGGVDALEDPRVRVAVAELCDHLRRTADRYDLLLLDVDNGPGWLAASANGRLYERTGLEACRAALRPGGVAAFWSPGQNGLLSAGLAAAFGDVQELSTAAIDPGAAGPSDVVVLAQRG